MIGSGLAILLFFLETLVCQTVPSGFASSGWSGIAFVDWMHGTEFNRSIPLTGKPAYPEDKTSPSSDFKCNDKGYAKYLKKWTLEEKSYKNDVDSEEYKNRLEYFKQSCKRIHRLNYLNSYKLQFTFYADWDPAEFERLTTSQVEYTHIPLAVDVIDTDLKNVNYRYLMPSMDPCEKDPSLRSVVSNPSSTTVSWAFAVTNAIEYAIKKEYLEQFDQIVEVSLSAQELIDCVGPYYGIDEEGGFPLDTAFDYALDNGIAYSEFYPYTHVKKTCYNVTAEHKFYISFYEKIHTYNRLGLFDLMARGPVAVLMGLDPAYFQVYRSDRAQGPYFFNNYYAPSVYGVLVEYSQYATEGKEELSSNPYFAIETRLRGCDSFVFRLPILNTNDTANIGGIAGYAIRPVVHVSVNPTASSTIAPTAPTTRRLSEHLRS